MADARATEKFRERLEEEKTRLESEMGSVGRRNTAVPGDWEPLPSVMGTEADIIDQADEVVSRETNSAILADLEARYSGVVAALERIEKGAYGVCEVCGKKIELARLTADPTATTCIAHL